MLAFLTVAETGCILVINPSQTEGAEPGAVVCRLLTNSGHPDHVLKSLESVAVLFRAHECTALVMHCHC